jgi:hypothetical protein
MALRKLRISRRCIYDASVREVLVLRRVAVVRVLELGLSIGRGWRGVIDRHIDRLLM